MLSIVNISKSYGGKELFREASLQLTRGEKVGLVGPNGAGKSTLFKMVLGQEEADSGEVTLERRCTVGFLPQETAAVGNETVLEIAIGVHPELPGLLRKLKAGEEADHGHEVDPHSRYAELGGFEIEARAKQILNGLSFRERDFDRPARELSGGWTMRAHLARLLVQEPDLLLLDEPTNHLDLSSLLWFQGHLKNYPGAILMISHDREFLNELVDSIVDVRFGRLNRYHGDYNDYLVQREANEANQLAAYKNQQKEIERLMLFVERFRAKNTKAAQAQSKLKQIERMEKIEAPMEDARSIGFSFPQPQRSGQRVLTIKNLDFSYGSNPVYRGLNFEVERGERIVLVGPNGAGKSTLLKLMGGVLQGSGGERELGHNVRCGYYSQNRVEMLNLERSVLEEALDTPQRVTEQSVRTLLGCFLFRGDDVLKPVRVLSGGEKSRLALVKLLLDPPNFLLMDEPTTHLDMASIEALVEALQQYEGTLVFISHDVYFIRALANHVVHVENGVLRRYSGDYAYYLEKSQQTTPSGSFNNTKPARMSEIRAMPSKELRKQQAEERKERSRAKKAQAAKVQEIESRISELEERQEEIHQALLDPLIYQDGEAVAELNRELKANAAELEELHGRWETEASALEALQQPEQAEA